ncbi:hypothetical protein MYX78_03575, partial [Acidobacteria bacterium AH-259-G07]|nr:hypothetical protein [Acidobacteria bacterium AH-259-G07]
FFARILVDQGKTYHAVGLGTLYAVINLPHYMKLKAFAVGWLTPLAYTRLGFLLVFLLSVILLFRPFVKWSKRDVLFYLPLLGLLAGLNTVFGYLSFGSEPQDGALRLNVSGSQFQRHLGLIVQAPDLGLEKTVFSYCEILDDRYGIFSIEGQPWTPESPRNYYNPDLASDDTSLLVQTVENGRREIWRSKGVGKPPAFLIEGATPSWEPNGTGFVFERGGKLYIFDVVTAVETWLPVDGNCYDPRYSTQGDSLVYGVKEKDGTSLRYLDLSTFTEKILFRSKGHIESPQFSHDGRKIVFSADLENSQDIWALDLVKNTLLRLTLNSALDRDPVWDQAHSRIVFASDRGRGLGCTTLFWIPIPEELR